MEPIGFSLIVLGAASTGLWAAHRERRRLALETKIRRDLTSADQRVAREFHDARRAMNNAAGQSWRNLAG